jgi:sulfate/thiosulfate transport system ATP-binding protein
MATRGDGATGIKVEGVTKRFGDFVALDDVSIDVPEGSLTALLGPSGSGKSTLLRLIAGLERPDAGRVLLAGKDVSRVTVQDRGVGFVFQHYAAFKHMTVRDNVAFGLKIRKVPRDQIKQRVKELMKLVQLQGMAHRYPAQLSGGQRQRMALARALAVEPKVLLLDEPFGALDATVRKELRQWLRRLHDEVHVTTIFVTHDQEEAMDIARQIVVMNDGRIEQAGSPTELYEHPSSEFVMGFVGEANRFGEAFVRPHDLDLALQPNDGAERARVERVVRLGFEVRVELTMPDDVRMWAQVTRAEASELELEEGQLVYVRPSRRRLFHGTEPTTEEAYAA